MTTPSSAGLFPLFKLALPLSGLQQSMLALLSGLLLSLPFLFAQYFYLTWFALVPFLVALEGASLKRSYLLGLVCGIAFFVSAGYWISDFLMLSKQYSWLKSHLWGALFWLYSAQLFALIALLLQWLKKHISVSELWLFPTLIVVLNSLYPLLFAVRLGESQSQFLSALQGIEFTGVYGLDALIALANVCLYALLFRPAKKAAFKASGYALAVSLLTGWFAFGMVTNAQWEQRIAQWPTTRIGIVQPNEPPDLGPPKFYPGFSRAYPPEMEMTKSLASAGAELVIWPESRYKGYFDQAAVRRAYQDQLARLGLPLLFQDMKRNSREGDEKLKTLNSAALLDSGGELSDVYAKIKRIPFGEYVPLAQEFPVLEDLTKRFFGEFLNDIAPGPAQQHFKLQDKSILPLICYETMFPEFVATSAAKLSEGAIITALSSNGWFGTSLQPYQHTNTSVLRAIENRLPLIHALNNGPSIAALPNGRVIFETDIHRAGGYILDLPYPTQHQPSFYSKHPHWFPYSTYFLFFGLCGMALFGRRFR